MPNGTVEAVGKSRSGKPTVTVGGQVYSSSQCDPPTTNLQVGDKIEFECASSVYNNATIWFMNSFKLLEAAIKYPPQGQPQGTNAASVSQAPVLNGITEGERATISNWVAGAIQAGLIKDPADMGIWAASACQAIKFAGQAAANLQLGDRLKHFLDHGTDPNDKIPFGFLMPLAVGILGASTSVKAVLPLLTG